MSQPTKEQIEFAIEVLQRHIVEPDRPGSHRTDIIDEIRELQKQSKTAVESERPKWLTAEVIHCAYEMWKLHTTDKPMRLKTIEYLKMTADIAGKKISSGEGLQIFRKFVEK